MRATAHPYLKKETLTHEKQDVSIVRRDECLFIGAQFRLRAAGSHARLPRLLRAELL
jgi:hypothetical protein